MIEENNAMVTKAVFSEDKTHRYLLCKEWDVSLHNVMVIMLQAGKSNALIQDVTTCNIINCVSELDDCYGSVTIVNLFSRVDLELDSDIDMDDFTNQENDEQIEQAAEKAEIIVLAYGKAHEINLCVKQRVKEVIELLKQHKNKMFVIGDEKGRKGFSAMYPKVRNKWILYKAYEEEKKEDKKQQNDKVAESIETSQTNQQSARNHKNNNKTKAKKKQK